MRNLKQKRVKANGEPLTSQKLENASILKLFDDGKTLHPDMFASSRESSRDSNSN